MHISPPIFDSTSSSKSSRMQTVTCNLSPHTKLKIDQLVVTLTCDKLGFWLTSISKGAKNVAQEFFCPSPGPNCLLKKLPGAQWCYHKQIVSMKQIGSAPNSHDTDTGDSVDSARLVIWSTPNHLDQSIRPSKTEQQFQTIRWCIHFWLTALTVHV